MRFGGYDTGVLVLGGGEGRLENVLVATGVCECQECLDQLPLSHVEGDGDHRFGAVACSSVSTSLPFGVAEPVHDLIDHGDCFVGVGSDDVAHLATQHGVGQQILLLMVFVEEVRIGAGPDELTRDGAELQRTCAPGRGGERKHRLVIDVGVRERDERFVSASIVDLQLQVRDTSFLELLEDAFEVGGGGGDR